jgi:hypothetical protein
MLLVLTWPAVRCSSPAGNSRRAAARDRNDPDAPLESPAPLRFHSSARGDREISPIVGPRGATVEVIYLAMIFALIVMKREPEQRDRGRGDGSSNDDDDPARDAE